MEWGFLKQQQKKRYGVDIFRYKNVLITLAILAFVLPAALHLLAAPPGTKYTPGETLDPTCEPGDTNCTVDIAAGSVTQESSGSQVAGQIPFWTATSSELSKSSNAFVWDDTQKFLGINMGGTPTASLDIGNVNDGSLNLVNVTGSLPPLSGGSAGNFLVTLSSGNGPSANGGGVAFMTGSGAGDGVSPGVGGVFQVLTGDGGSATFPSAGGAIQLTTGAGGSAIGPAQSNGSAGGDFIFTGGLGGNGNGFVSGNGGKGGSLNLLGGDGGDAGPAAATNGAGGDITILGGLGNSTGPGAAGANGNVLLATTHGRVGIGLGSPSYPLHVKGDVGGVVAKFETTSGSTACTLNGTTGLLSCSSDRALKKNIEDISSSLAKILELKPVSYLWNTDDESADKKFGFIAQDVEEVFPSLVSTDTDSGNKFLSIQGLTPYIVKAMQEMNAKIDALNGQTNSTIQQVVSAVLEKLTIGSQDHPTGITLFDKSTGEPYCVGVNNGQVESTAGECQ